MVAFRRLCFAGIACLAVGCSEPEIEASQPSSPSTPADTQGPDVHVDVIPSVASSGAAAQKLVKISMQSPHRAKAVHKAPKPMPAPEVLPPDEHFDPPASADEPPPEEVTPTLDPDPG